MPLALKWLSYVDTDVDVAEFFDTNHTISMFIMLQFPHSFAGPAVCTPDGGYMIGQADFGGLPFGYGACPAGGEHDDTDSVFYTLAFDAPGASGQHGWRRCKKCQSIFFGGNGIAATACAAGGNHDGSASGDFAVPQGVVGDAFQQGWRWCRNCQSLFHAEGGDTLCPAAGVPATGAHDASGSGQYSIFTFPTLLPTQIAGAYPLRRCTKCQGLFYAGETTKLLVIAGAPGATFNTTIVQGAWYHYAIVRKSDVLRAYLDGKPLDPPLSLFGVAAPTGKLRLGRMVPAGFGPHSAAQFFGLIDDLAIYKRALSVAELQAAAKRTGHLAIAVDDPKEQFLAGWTFGGLKSPPAKLNRPLVLNQGAALVSNNGFRSLNDVRLLPVPTPKVPLRLPFPRGQIIAVTQGMDDPFMSHSGLSAFCYDFVLTQFATKNASNFAMAPGLVETVVMSAKSGEARPGNIIAVIHAENEVGGYDHLAFNSSQVGVGDYVHEGQLLALTGDTGATAGAFHLHCGLNNGMVKGTVTVPAAFSCYEVSNDDGKSWSFVPLGMPQQGQLVRNPADTAPQQGGWLECTKCSALFFGGAAGTGLCPSGAGVHEGDKAREHSLPLDAGAQQGQHGWNWCHRCQGLFFPGAGTANNCSAGGSHDGSQSGDYSLVVDAAGADEPGWLFCNNCQGLFFENSPANHCKAGGGHDGSASGRYTLRTRYDGPRAQDGWRFCKKCAGLFFAGGGSNGTCPNTSQNAAHNALAGMHFRLTVNAAQAPGQRGWAWCKNCQGLFFASDTGAGKCPGGPAHDGSESGAYTVIVNRPDAVGQHQWRWCKNCHGLFFSGNPSASHCPKGGGPHDGSESDDYSLLVS